MDLTASLRPDIAMPSTEIESIRETLSPDMAAGVSSMAIATSHVASITRLGTIDSGVVIGTFAFKRGSK